MIQAKLADAGDFINLTFDTHREKVLVHKEFTKKWDNWFVVKKKNPYATVEDTFINQYDMIPVGLWQELVKVAVKYGLSVNFSDDFNCRIKNCSITRDMYDRYIEKLFAESYIQPRQYQVDSAFNLLLFKKACIEVGTGGGKTLIAYILFRFLKDMCGMKRFLYITPKTNLTTQSGDKFKTYDESCKIETDWTFSEIHASAKKKSEYNETIVFANYQSLARKPAEFFDQFDVVINDETHHATASSIRTILSKCNKAHYKCGVTGTFPKEGTCNNFIVQSYIGPLVYVKSSDELINEEHAATPVYVNMVYLDYLGDEEKKELYDMRNNRVKGDVDAGSELFNIEKKVLWQNEKRLSYICKMVGCTVKNSLVVFTDKQHGYGKAVYQYIKENYEKDVYYIDGDTNTKVREQIKECMEEDTTGNTVIVASAGCFSEGIDLCNLWNIFLIETTKSDTVMAQLLGRGMRKYPGKDKTIMVDFVDNFRYGTGYAAVNYLLKHGNERKKIYEERKFPVVTYNVKV